MPDRRVHFYRALTGRDDDLAPLPFEAEEALGEVGQLDFFDEENGAYVDLGDGDKAFCVVDRIQAPQHLRIARSRRTHLPPVETAGEFEDLDLDDDSGLAEESFFVFFEHNIVGVIYNSFSPRVSMFRRYVKARCAERFHGVELAPLIRQDLANRLEELSDIRVLDLRVFRSFAGELEEASATLARSVRVWDEVGRPEQVGIVLQPEPYGRSFLNRDILGAVRRLFRLPRLSDGVTRFKVKGFHEPTGQLDEIDVLKEQLVVYRDVQWEDRRSARLYAPSAFNAIEAAYDELEGHLIAASAAI